MKPRLVLACLLGLALVALVWWVARPTPAHPTLFDRYAEQWGWGKSGESIPLLEGLRLPATVGTRQMFTPAVCAPPETTLTNVVLSISLPDNGSWLLEGAENWQYDDRGDRMVESYLFGLPINRGTCGNGTSALFFTPIEPGAQQIHYSISSIELPEFTGSFIVEAK